MKFLVFLVLVPTFLKAIDACCFSDSFTMNNIKVNLSGNKTVDDPNSNVVYNFFVSSKASGKLSADFKGARFAFSGSLEAHSDMLFSGGADSMNLKFKVLAASKGPEPFLYAKVDGKLTGQGEVVAVFSRCVKIPMEPMIQYVLPNYQCLPQMVFMPDVQIVKNGMRSMVFNPQVVAIPGQLEILFDKDVCAPVEVVYAGQPTPGAEAAIEFSSEPKEGVEEALFETPDMNTCHEMTTEELKSMVTFAVPRRK